jgi:hypothetical protein
MKAINTLKETIVFEELEYAQVYWFNKYNDYHYKNWKRCFYLFNVLDGENKLMRALIVSHSPKRKMFGMVFLKTTSNKSANISTSNVISVKIFKHLYGFVPQL